MLETINRDRSENVKIYEDNERIINSRNDLKEDIRLSLENTKYYNSTPAVSGFIKGTPKVTVVNSSAVMEASKFSSAMILNFASAVHAGGGYIRGANAQEESLCRCSGLYNILKEYEQHYKTHRDLDNTMYTDAMIYSPLVPFFKDDYGFETDKKYFDVLTAAFPNNRSKEHSNQLLVTTYERRIRKVLAIASARKQSNVILGAWGCGAFGNDPELVAMSFAKVLKTVWPFDNIVFAVMDNRDEKLLSTFKKYILGETK